MPYEHVYANALELQILNTKIGNGDCVPLVQHFTNVGHTSGWRPGLRVMDALLISEGTVIATFEKGRYPNRKTGNHACFFLHFGPISQSTGKPAYIVVMDQWKRKAQISMRRIEPRGRLQSEGNPVGDSDNADAYYVVW